MDLWPSTEEASTLTAADVATMLSHWTGLELAADDIDTVVEDGVAYHELDGMPFDQWGQAQAMN